MFLEPVVGVALVVECGDLGTRRTGTAGSPRLAAGWFPAAHGCAPPAGVLFEPGQDAPPNAEAAGAGGDPHPFQFGRPSAVQLQRPAADRFAVQVGQEKDTGGFDQLGGGDRDAAVGSNPPSKRASSSAR